MNPDQDGEHRCERCEALITTGLMAAFCPRRERCEFWPDDPESQAFLDSLGWRIEQQEREA